MQAKSLRQSVDVMRLSRIALSNLEKEGDGSDYAAAEVSISLPWTAGHMGICMCLSCLTPCPACRSSLVTSALRMQMLSWTLMSKRRNVSMALAQPLDSQLVDTHIQHVPADPASHMLDV